MAVFFLAPPLFFTTPELCGDPIYTRLMRSLNSAMDIRECVAAY